MTGQHKGSRKSNRSKAGAECIEVATAIDGTIGVQGSKQRGVGPVLEVGPDELAALLAVLRRV